MQPQLILFTDLDGTLLDNDTYAYDAALPGLSLLRQHQVPLIFCSAKTHAEQAVYRQVLDVHDPFIVENGGAILIEDDTLAPQEGVPHPDGRHRVITFGRAYREIRTALEALRRDAFPELRGYGDLSVEHLMPLLNLDAEATHRATQREYEETIVTPLSPERTDALRAALETRGLTLTRGGRFISVSAGNNKGQAVQALTRIYRQRWPNIVTAGLGDSWNDTPMLNAVDHPILVQRPGGRWEDVCVPNLRRVVGVGPQGWTLAIQKLLGNGPPPPPR